jgi:hypothetical protein
LGRSDRITIQGKYLKTGNIRIVAVIDRKPANPAGTFSKVRK